MPDHDPDEGYYDEDPANRWHLWFDLPLTVTVLCLALRQHPDAATTPIEAVANYPAPTPIVVKIDTFPRSGVVERQHVLSEFDVPDMKLAAVSTPFE